MQPREYGFAERLQSSDSSDANALVATAIPGSLYFPRCDVVIERASPSDDRKGTDYWVCLPGGIRFRIDLKLRDDDYSARGKDDLALETWSVIERQHVGWTRDPSKQTDYILWIWKSTGRREFVPYKLLRQVFRERWQEWSSAFDRHAQYTWDGGYHSECVFVPRSLVWKEINRLLPVEHRSVQ